MNSTYKLVAAGLAVAFALIAGASFGIAFKAEGVAVPGNFVHTINQDSQFFDTYTFFSATTTTATSTNAATSNDPGWMKITGARDVVFYFTRGDTKGTGNTGSSRFNVQVTPDGVNWYDYNELGQVTISTTDNAFWTRQGTTTISAATSTQMWAMEDIDFLGVRCITVRTTDGEASCSASAQYLN